LSQLQSTGSVDLVVAKTNEWQLQISVEKCNILTVGDCPVNSKYSIDIYEIPNKPCCRDLGIIVSFDLNHCNYIIITAKTHR